MIWVIGHWQVPFLILSSVDYLRSLSWLEINGLFFLFEYAKKLVKSKQPEVIEGITRPNHLVKELQVNFGIVLF